MPNELPDADRDHMRRALDLARRGWGQTAPNPMVGAVVVRDGEVVGEGFHARYGESHAEVVALAAAGERARGATLYVTLEPCTHHGKTPPCADAVIAAGVHRVVIATSDPNPEAAGGAARLRQAGISVEIGLESDAACELNAPFFHAFASKRPWIILKLATSLDGGIADASRTRGSAGNWLTGDESRREVHRMRAGVDAVAVGIGTVLADDPLLTVREAPAPRVPPRRVIFDSELRTPLGAGVVRGARVVPTTIIARRAAPDRHDAMAQAGVDVRVYETLEAALLGLAANGIRAMLVEGGARLAASLLEQGMVDRLVIFQAPLVLGAGALNPFAYLSSSAAAALGHLRVIERVTLGSDLKTTFALGAASCSQDSSTTSERSRK
ncbi:MAG TPA: bifunctional diaminohydroxyphosphoribosylaminopyrimidine deaminase/5-amino-6-(5-phosphoribosylamino)uracil reductase RibD [Gemmatimonadaceae bacterium]|nr:bifunctional diaminohydroxyphosphoribosylaminopyrimidine deaminase/5-amino-6-(5-phosphoribosylamino)uracil reductase RibD [Gemmatimonadaceae bacterium]